MTEPHEPLFSRPKRNNNLEMDNLDATRDTPKVTFHDNANSNIASIFIEAATGDLYMNANTTTGDSGYGLRYDVSGSKMQYKNSGGSWIDIGSGVGGYWSDEGSYLKATEADIRVYSGANYIKLNHDGTDGYLSVNSGDLYIDAPTDIQINAGDDIRIKGAETVDIEATTKDIFLSAKDDIGCFIDSVEFFRLDYGLDKVIVSKPLAIGAYTLPITDGTDTQVLITNGIGTVSWGAATGAFSCSDLSTCNLTNLGTYNHNDLQNIQGGAGADYYHLTSAQRTDLTDSGDCSIHKHDDKWTDEGSYLKATEDEIRMYNSTNYIGIEHDGSDGIITTDGEFYLNMGGSAHTEYGGSSSTDFYFGVACSNDASRTGATYMKLYGPSANFVSNFLTIGHDGNGVVDATDGDLRMHGANITLRVDDNAGVNYLELEDSDAATVFKVDSNGAITASDTLNMGTNAISNVTTLTANDQIKAEGSHLASYMGYFKNTNANGFSIYCESQLNAIYAKYTGTTGTAGALALASSSITSGNIMNISHDTSTFTGNVIYVKVADGSGSFSHANSDFIEFWNSTDDEFYVAHDGWVWAGGDIQAHGSFVCDTSATDIEASGHEENDIGALNTAFNDVYADDFHTTSPEDFCGNAIDSINKANFNDKLTFPNNVISRPKRRSLVKEYFRQSKSVIKSNGGRRRTFDRKGLRDMIDGGALDKVTDNIELENYITEKQNDDSLIGLSLGEMIAVLWKGMKEMDTRMSVLESN